MTEKFTPGEWVHCILGGECGYPFVFENKTGEGIASVFIQQGNTEKAIANAALISAAPDMYNELSRDCAICKLRDHETGCEFCRIGKVLKKARGEG